MHSTAFASRIVPLMPMTNNPWDPKQNDICRTMQWRPRQVQTNYYGSRASPATTNGPPCKRGDISEGAQNTMPGFMLDKLPEDILNHIHSLVPLRDAARAACVSRGFLRSWRCFPNLTLNWEALGMNGQERTAHESAKDFVDRVHILQNHSGIGVKTLKLQLYSCRNVILADYLDRWLQVAVKSEIVELAVELPRGYSPEYNFSCSLLSDKAASSLQSLSLSCCAFHPTLRIGCLRSLTSVCLKFVHITGEEVGCFLSSTFALETLALLHCDEMTFLKIPSHLQQLSFLQVFLCMKLYMIESNAPKLTTVSYGGAPIKLSIGDSSQVRYMCINGTFYSGMIQYARTKLPSITSNLQTLTLTSSGEDFNTPMLPDKFLHLKYLNIIITGQRAFSNYDYFSLLSFLEASPALESFYLCAGEHGYVRNDSILRDSNGESSHMRRIPEFHHDNLKKVSITGFCSAKSLIELTCQILENTSSLQWLVLDTTHGFDSKYVRLGRCRYMSREAVSEAQKAVEAVRRYVEGKVPSNVNVKLWEPCRRCHTSNL